MEAEMFRLTGPGQVQVDVRWSGAGVLKALLYNFDFDDFADRKFRPLKPEHNKFLNDEVVPLLENDRGNIWMQGSASRIGTNFWNMTLSQTRVGRVQAYLADQEIGFDQMEVDAVGEEVANKLKHTEDDPHDRSVTIWVLPKLKFDPPPPKRVPPKPKVTRAFKIAMVTDLSASYLVNLEKKLAALGRSGLGKALSKGKGGVALDFGVFIVWDTTNNLSCLYVYIGIGLAAGLTFTPSGSATTHGPWNKFTTEKPIGCWQFGRWSRFTTAGVAKWSVNWITIETPKGVDNVESLRIDTGTTLGLGASTTVGDFIRVDGPSVFAGP
jgi:hypothetical protein